MNYNYDHCLEMLLEHEGGFVNHPKDPGGITNLGITKKVYEDWVGHSVSKQDMENLTRKDVAPIYKKNYWDRGRCDDLPSGVDWSVFDWGVNSGMSRAAKALQKIVAVKADGGIGPMTLQAVANFKPEILINKMHSNRQNFYEKLQTFEAFGRGWTRRNNQTKEAALEMMQKN